MLYLMLFTVNREVAHFVDEYESVPELLSVRTTHAHRKKIELGLSSQPGLTRYLRTSGVLSDLTRHSSVATYSYSLLL